MIGVGQGDTGTLDYSSYLSLRFKQSASNDAIILDMI